MSFPSQPQIIVYGYKMAPNPNKLFQFLSLYALPYKYVELPMIMPRPQLLSIGVTYRRTPLLSINADMYIDNALIISKLNALASHSSFSSSSSTTVSPPVNHIEYDALGQMGFQLAMGLLPASTPFLADAAFLADRADLFGGRPMNPAAMVAARPRTLSKMLSLLQLIETNLLRAGHPFFLAGEEPSTADLYLYWGLDAMRRHGGAAPEISEETRPRIFAWLDAVAGYLKGRSLETKIEMGEAEAVLRGTAPYEEVEHVQGNLEGLRQGQRVRVTPTDMGKSGPQVGRLVALNYDEICLVNEKGVVMHFPRLGYEVVGAEEEEKLKL